MISRSTEQILIASPDGSIDIFNPSELQARIYQACLESGFEDPWLAEDLALSLEYLILKTGDRREFKEDEILNLVCRLLEETGHHLIASRFRKNCGFKSNNIDCTNIEVLNKFYSQSGIFAESELRSEIEKIHNALEILGLKNATQEFLLEMARQCSQNKLNKIETKFSSSVNNDVLILSKEDITCTIKNDPLLKDYCNNSVIIFHPISSLFPSIKISIHLAKFAKMKGIEPPVTELILNNYLDELAAALNKASSILNEKLREKNYNNDVPVFAKFADIITFFKDYLCTSEAHEGSVKTFFDFIKTFMPSKIIIK